MRSIIVLALIAIIACNTDITTSDVNPIQCLFNGFLELKPEIIELINEIKAQNMGEVLRRGLLLFHEAQEIVTQCLDVEADLKRNWPAFGKCLLKYTPGNIPMAIAIATKNYVQAAILLPDFIDNNAKAYSNCKSLL